MRRHGSASHGLQAAIAEYLLRAVYSPAFSPAVKERWAKIAGCPVDVVVLEEQFLREQIRGLEAGSRMDAFRTWLSGWTTKHRMHGSSRGCCFGRKDGNDATQHDVQECLSFAEVMDEVFATQPGPLCWLGRFGVSPPDPRRAALVAILYRIVAARDNQGVDKPGLRDLACALMAARPGLKAAE